MYMVYCSMMLQEIKNMKTNILTWYVGNKLHEVTGLNGVACNELAIVLKDNPTIGEIYCNGKRIKHFN